MQAKSSESAFTFLVLVRKDFRNRMSERRRLAVLLEDIIERYQSPVILGMSKRNNISVMQTAVISPAIEPVIFDEYSTAGHYINVLLKQVKTPYCMVLWDDMWLEGRFNEQLVRHLLETDSVIAAPLCYDQEITMVPTLSSPLLSKSGEFSVLPTMPANEAEKTLYPYDYVGMYQMDAFFKGPGFDQEMDDGYWQLSDFGLSYWERDLSIRMCSTLTIRYLHHHSEDYVSTCTAEKKFRAKHFGYTVNKRGVHYHAKARRILRDHIAKHEHHMIQQKTEAEVLIAAWEEL
jgi:hypothetical protein